MTRNGRHPVDVVLYVCDTVPSVLVRCHAGRPGPASINQLAMLIRTWARAQGAAAPKEDAMAGEMVGLEKYGPNPDWRLLENHGYWTIQRRTAFSQVRFEPDTWVTLEEHFATQADAIAHIDAIIADEQMSPANPAE